MDDKNLEQMKITNRFLEILAFTSVVSAFCQAFSCVHGI